MCFLSKKGLSPFLVKKKLLDPNRLEVLNIYLYFWFITKDKPQLLYNSLVSFSLQKPVYSHDKKSDATILESFSYKTINWF